MSDQFIGQVLAEKYRIDSLMRETELGKVYRGTHLLMDKRVLVKILSPVLAVDENIVELFSAEAQTVSKISHLNILNITDFGADTNGTVFIVFENAEGETLRQKIRKGEIFSAERAIKIVRQIASALSAAHLKGIFHQSLTSENILLSDDDTVKVLDLGAFRNTESLEDEIESEKIQYLSPEQCADPSSADERSDVYSLGVIFYEMLAGEVPFKAENTNELMMKHAQEPPPPLSSFRRDLPPEIEPVILQTLAKNPEMRHQTTAELIDDLNRIARQLTNAQTVFAQNASASTSNIWKTAFIVLAGISLLSVGLIWATSGRRTNVSTLQYDANSQPVQPINPATGMNEQGLANLVQTSQTELSNSNMILTMPETLTGGSSNPYWQNGTVPPGAPQYIPSPGNTITVPDCDPNNPFMPCDVQIVTQPVPANSNVNTTPSSNLRPTKSPAANVSPSPQTTESPKPSPEVKATPAKTETPAPKPTEQKTPASQNKKSESGKTEDGY
jgi:serine/threonine protein kinase